MNHRFVWPGGLLTWPAALPHAMRSIAASTRMGCRFSLRTGLSTCFSRLKCLKASAMDSKSTIGNNDRFCPNLHTGKQSVTLPKSTAPLEGLLHASPGSQSNPRLMSMRDFQDGGLENQSGPRRRSRIQTESSQAGGRSPVSILSVLRHWAGVMALDPLWSSCAVRCHEKHYCVWS